MSLLDHLAINKLGKGLQGLESAFGRTLVVVPASRVRFNPGGEGDNVLGNVDFKPWATTAACDVFRSTNPVDKDHDDHKDHDKKDHGDDDDDSDWKD